MKIILFIISIAVSLTLCGCSKPQGRSAMSTSSSASMQKAVPKGEVASQSVVSATYAPQSTYTPTPTTPKPDLINVTYMTYKSDLYGFMVDIPDFLSRDTTSDAEDAFVSVDGKTKIKLYASDRPILMYNDVNIDLMYEDVLSNIKYSPGYTAKKNDWFVISWDTSDTVFYLKYYLKSTGEENILVFSYPKVDETAYDDIVTRVSKSFSPGTPAFNEAEFVYITKTALGVPSDLNVTYKLGDEYYWEAGERYLRSISFYHNGEKVAGASFDPYSYDMMSDIYTYTP